MKLIFLSLQLCIISVIVIQPVVVKTMSAAHSDRAGKEKRDDLTKRRTLTKLGVDSSGQPRQAGKSAKFADKASFGQQQQSSTSTPLNSGQQPRAGIATKTGCQSPSRRRTDASVRIVTEEIPVTPRSGMGARRSATEFRTPDCFSAVAFETPVAQLKLKRTCGEEGVVTSHDDYDCQALSSSVTVAVRVRPFMARSVFAFYQNRGYG